MNTHKNWWKSPNLIIAVFAIIAITLHVALYSKPEFRDYPVIAVLIFGGLPLVFSLAKSIAQLDFGADILAGISIVVSAILGEYLAGAIVVLMLSGGESLEQIALGRASSVLKALANRMPSVAHKRQNGEMKDIEIDAIEVGDELVVFPNEICPVDGVVLDGTGGMDESFLTGEPFEVRKVAGATVISGAINQNAVITIEATALAEDSRYARIMNVMEEAQQTKPKIRRLADRLGAWYTPLALSIAGFAWLLSGEPIRFLAVLVVATPCPLLISIPVALIGSISLAAKRSIVIRDPTVLEQLSNCRTLLFDKTGTLTIGRPKLEIVKTEFDRREALRLAASLEQFSKHPLAEALIRAAQEEGITLGRVSEMREQPGAGLVGRVDDLRVALTSRKKVEHSRHPDTDLLPPTVSGLESVLLVNNRYHSTFVFRDQPRPEGEAYVSHLGPHHGIDRVMIVSGDRESEVQFLAKRVGIQDTFANRTPEQKVEIVLREEKRAPTVFVGDGINDAPALSSATVGIAMGQNSDITSEAAGAIILEPSLRHVDELFHISSRFRGIAFQSAVGGMALSSVGMGFAAFGFLTPVAGAIVQEVIDLLSIANALRVSILPESLSDDF